MKLYAGIGSPDTPEPVLRSMARIAVRLSCAGYTLRSGHGRGADQAFEGPVSDNRKEIFVAGDATPAAIKLASQFHPAWDQCNDLVRKLHGRNAMIMLGRKLKAPVKFVVCWTHNGKDVGGTGLGIRIAQHFSIPVYNLQDPAQAKDLWDLMRGL